MDARNPAAPSPARRPREDALSRPLRARREKPTPLDFATLMRRVKAVVYDNS
jgi:hypothetical protein